MLTQDLDRLLRCSICFEYYKTAMMMPNCSHNCESVSHITKNHTVCTSWYTVQYTRWPASKIITV